MSRNWLRDAREKNKLTQKDVGTLAGISESYYNLIENGARTPTVETAKKIAEALNFEWTQFFPATVPG